MSKETRLHQKRYEEKSEEIIEVLNSPIHKTRQTIALRSCIVLCGVSGSGKTSAIELANEKLPHGEQIAESLDILRCVDAVEARKILESDDSEYGGCRHVAYTIVNRDIGKALSELDVWPVVFIYGTPLKHAGLRD